MHLQTNLSSEEEKWHRELGNFYASDFWNATYRLTSEIKNENKRKWIQFQINRHCLHTNHKVNKFNPLVSPLCTFCQLENIENPSHELISHLFFSCGIVQMFWKSVGSWLASLDIAFPFDQLTLLFGCHNQSSFSVINYVILSAKYYIWVSKLKKQLIDLRAFKKVFLFQLEGLKNAYIHEGNLHKFNQWQLIFDNLSE